MNLNFIPVNGKSEYFDYDEFEKSINDITGEKCGWCPYCVNKKMCNEDKCIDCYSKSFAT